MASASGCSAGSRSPEAFRHLVNGMPGSLVLSVEELDEHRIGDFGLNERRGGNRR